MVKVHILLAKSDWYSVCMALNHLGLERGCLVVEGSECTRNSLGSNFMFCLFMKMICLLINSGGGGG